MKRNLSVISLLLVLCTLCALLLGCVNNGDGETTTDGNSAVTTLGDQNTEERLEPVLPEDKLTGFKLSIANSGYSDTKYNYSRLTADEINGSTINDATFRRNKKVEDAIGITIEEYEVTVDNINIKLGAGDKSYNLVMVNLSNVMSVVNKNYAYDLNEIDTIDLTMPWWDQNAAEKLHINGHLFYTFSDATIFGLDNTRATYFNKTIYTDVTSELELEEDLYDLVESDRWTVDKMLEFGALATSDGGDGEWTAADTYGISNAPTTVYEAMLTGCNAEIIQMSDTGVPYFFPFEQKERFIAIYDYLIAGFNKDNVYFAAKNATQSRTMFETGNTLFTIDTLLEGTNLRQLQTVNFGILPVAKYTVEQENYVNVSPNPHAMLVPFNVGDSVDALGYALEAMSYFGSRHYADDALISAYFEIVLKSQNINDVESAESLQIIHDNISYVNKIVGTEFSDVIFKTYFANAKKDISGILSGAQRNLQEKKLKDILLKFPA